jgi:four helix bundle protein
MGEYRSLRVWRAAHELTLEVYQETSSFPPAERFGLTGQMRRAASSIPANLAEGCGRDSDAEIARFARIALGSANELDYHLLLARDLGLLEPAAFEQLGARTRRVMAMLARLAQSLSPRDRRPTTDD